MAASAGTFAWGENGDRLFLALYGTGLRPGDGSELLGERGGGDHDVAGAHPTYPGLDQVNLEIPPGMRGTVTVQCTADGLTSNAVTVAME